MKTKQQLFKEFCNKHDVSFSNAVEARQAGLLWPYETININLGVYDTQRAIQKQMIRYNSNKLYKWFINKFYDYSYLITLNQLINEYTQAIIDPEQAKIYLEM